MFVLDHVCDILSDIFLTESFAWLAVCSLGEHPMLQYFRHQYYFPLYPNSASTLTYAQCGRGSLVT